MEKITLEKIPLNHFISILVELYESGANFVDITGTPNVEQDVIGISVKDEYIFDIDEEEDDDDDDQENNKKYVIEKHIKLTDDDLLKLIEE
jgi:hypothetical protein